ASSPAASPALQTSAAAAASLVVVEPPASPTSAAATILGASPAPALPTSPETSIPAPPPPPSLVKVLDMDRAKTLIKEQDWDAVEGYIWSILCDNQEHCVDDFARLHPALYLMFREEKLFQLLAENKIDEAHIFYQHSIVSLEDRDGIFLPVDLGVRIKNLDPSNSSSVPIRRSTQEELSRYVKLYFPKSIGREEYTTCEQFVEKHQLQNISSEKDCMICLACGWEVLGMWKMRPHFVYAHHVKHCSGVTQDLLNRLKNIDGKPILDFTQLVGKFEMTASSMSSKYSSATKKLKRKKTDMVACRSGSKRSRGKRSEEKSEFCDEFVLEKAKLIHGFCVDLANLMKTYVPGEVHVCYKKILDIQLVASSLESNINQMKLKDVFGSSNEDLFGDDFDDVMLKKLSELYKLCIDLGKFTKTSGVREDLAHFEEVLLRIESEVGCTLRVAGLKRAIWL
ncbi:hypothetical protein EE612_047834, partial [Oryza sativa]